MENEKGIIITGYKLEPTFHEGSLWSHFHREDPYITFHISKETHDKYHTDIKTDNDIRYSLDIKLEKLAKDFCKDKGMDMKVTGFRLNESFKTVNHKLETTGYTATLTLKQDEGGM